MSFFKFWLEIDFVCSNLRFWEDIWSFKSHSFVFNYFFLIPIFYFSLYLTRCIFKNHIFLILLIIFYKEFGFKSGNKIRRPRPSHNSLELVTASKIIVKQCQENFKALSLFRLSFKINQSWIISRWNTRQAVQNQKYFRRPSPEVLIQHKYSRVFIIFTLTFENFK